MNLTSLTYLILLGILLLYLILPHFEVYLSIDTTFLGLATLLVAYTIALILFGHMPRLKKFKLGAGGVEADFRELEEEAEKIEKEVTPESVKREIREIAISDVNPKAVFFELMVEIEKKLRLLSSKLNLGDSWRYRGVNQMVRGLEKEEVLDKYTANLILSFWNIRNRAVHGVVDITDENLREAIQIGEIILTRLDSMYTKQQKK